MWSKHFWLKIWKKRAIKSLVRDLRDLNEYTLNDRRNIIIGFNRSKYYAFAGIVQAPFTASLASYLSLNSGIDPPAIPFIAAGLSGVLAAPGLWSFFKELNRRYKIEQVARTSRGESSEDKLDLEDLD